MSAFETLAARIAAVITEAGRPLTRYEMGEVMGVRYDTLKDILPVLVERGVLNVQTRQVSVYQRQYEYWLVDAKAALRDSGAGLKPYGEGT